jgi:hypothetical protein
LHVKDHRYAPAFTGPCRVHELSAFQRCPGSIRRCSQCMGHASRSHSRAAEEHRPDFAQCFINVSLAGALRVRRD